MEHFTQETLLSYYFQELAGSEKDKVKAHLAGCRDCRRFIHELEMLDESLDLLEESQSLPATFDNVMTVIKRETLPVPLKIKSSTMPYIYFAISVLFCFSGIYLFHETIASLSVLQMLQQASFLDKIGSLGTTVLLFLLIGSFASLAMTPLLVLESGKQSEGVRYF